MRNVLLDERDHTLWDCDMVQQDYEFFKRHKDAFVRMWHVQVGNVCFNQNFRFHSMLRNFFHFFTHTNKNFQNTNFMQSAILFQGSLYWQRFIATYRRYYVHYGLLRSLPYDDEDKLHQVLLDQAFMYIQDCFLQG